MTYRPTLALISSPMRMARVRRDAGAGTFVWLVAFGVPYPIVLALMVALFDLIPVVG